MRALEAELKAAVLRVGKKHGNTQSVAVLFMPHCGNEASEKEPLGNGMRSEAG